MFKISKTKASLVSDQNRAVAGLPAAVDISSFCVTEGWAGDLANGLFQLGKVGGYFHGLQEGECGLLTLLRCYEPNDRVHILELLENASSSPSSFCYSTYIICGPGERQPIMCVGESGGFAESSNGIMHGIFIFPRMAPDIHGTH